MRMRAMRLQALLTWLAAAAVVCFALQVFSDNKADVDLWGNIGFVKALPGSAHFHTTNTYSYTSPDAAWINHEWLAEYVMHWTWRFLGNTGLLLLKVALGLTVLALMYRTLRCECASGALRLLLMLLIISTMSYGFSTRPHHFTYLMQAVWLALLKRYGGRAWLHLLALPALTVLWANLHGAFFIGVIVVLVYALTEWVKHRRDREPSRRRLLVMLGGVGLCVAASCINPYGLRLWAFVFESGASARPYLSEWEPFSPIRHGATHLDFVFLALTVGCAYPFSKTRKDVTWTALLYLSLVAAIVLRRNIPLFAIVAGFAAGPHIQGMGGPMLDRLAARVPRGVWALLLGLFIPFSLYSAATFNKRAPLEIEVAEADYPLRAVAFMKAQQLRGNVFVFFDWAEYCIWHLYPDCRVFMDGRFLSAYGKPVVTDYLAGLYGGPDWERVLTAYPTDMALVHYGNPIARHLAARPDWQLVYGDGPAVLFVKRPVHQALIERLGRNPTDAAGVPLPRPIFP